MLVKTPRPHVLQNIEAAAPRDIPLLIRVAKLGVIANETRRLIIVIVVVVQILQSKFCRIFFSLNLDAGIKKTTLTASLPLVQQVNKPANNRWVAPLSVIADSYYAEPVFLVYTQSLESIATQGTAFWNPYGM